MRSIQNWLMLMHCERKHKKSKRNCSTERYSNRQGALVTLALRRSLPWAKSKGSG